MMVDGPDTSRLGESLVRSIIVTNFGESEEQAARVVKNIFDAPTLFGTAVLLMSKRNPHPHFMCAKIIREKLVAAGHTDTGVDMLTEIQDSDRVSLAQSLTSGAKMVEARARTDNISGSLRVGFVAVISALSAPELGIIYGDAVGGSAYILRNIELDTGVFDLEKIADGV